MKAKNIFLALILFGAALPISAHAEGDLETFESQIISTTKRALKSYQDGDLAKVASFAQTASELQAQFETYREEIEGSDAQEYFTEEYGGAIELLQATVDEATKKI